MEEDFSDYLKYKVTFECVYIISNEKGLTEATIKEKAIKRFRSEIQEMEKQIEEEKKTPTPQVILFLEKALGSKPNIKPTLKEQLSLLNITIEKIPSNNNYFVLFRHEFAIITKIADKGLVEAIALKEAPFSDSFLRVLHMEVKRVPNKQN